MRHKVIWFAFSCLMVLSLVLASCGPSEPTTPASPTTQTSPTSSSQPTNTTTPTTPSGSTGSQGPVYGGSFTFIGSDPTGFDDGITMYITNGTCYLTNEDLLQGNWMKGPAGTNEISWMQGIVGRMEMLTGALAESYELVGSDTIIFHIRKGVYWQNKPPVNGREYTAEDAAWNLQRHFETPTAYLSRTWPVGQRPTEYHVLDKYTLEVKAPSATQGVMAMISGASARHFPPDMVEMYGDMTDWHNSCGTGPFMLTDYVPGSSMTYTRNPNYWMEDPANPGYTLPYTDTVKQLIIPDKSTRLAGLRTGKLDALHEYSFEDKESLVKTRPDLQFNYRLAPPDALFTRLDKPELPTSDIRVRWAMNMAIDRQSIVDDYYQGHAELFGYPYPPLKEHEPFYVPLSEMPQTVQDYYNYNPDKAKQMLKEAGYPDGFKITVICEVGDSDFVSIIADYMSAINIDLEIQALETSIYTTTLRARKHDAMIYTETKTYSFPFRMLDCIKSNPDNVAFWETPQTVETYAKVNASVGKDDAEVARLLREITPHRLEQASGIWMVSPEFYNIWQPWVKGYHGEFNIGYFNRSIFSKYLWIDQNLKKSMGY